MTPLKPKLLKAADLYRSKIDQRGGVVVFYNSKLQGWVNKLRNPEAWVPGCIAVDQWGNQWVTEGGNDIDGAKQWTPVVKAH